MEIEVVVCSSKDGERCIGWGDVGGGSEGSEGGSRKASEGCEGVKVRVKWWVVEWCYTRVGM